MNQRLRSTHCALLASLMTVIAVHVSAQDLVIDSGSDETVIPRIPNAPTQQQPVCADPGSGTLGHCANIFVDDLGQIGINTTAPENFVHILDGDVTPTTPLANSTLVVEADRGFNFIELISAEDSRSGLVFRPFPSFTGVITGAVLFDSEFSRLNFWTDGEERVRIDGGGRVGVGTGNLGLFWPFQVGVDGQGGGNGAYVTGSGVWTNGSDRNSKEDFQEVNKRDILTTLVDLPITRWRYKVDEDSTFHVGPVAQDFYAAFGLGHSNTHIGTIDADGVALAAIQGLYEVVLEKDQVLNQQQSQIVELTLQLRQLEARLDALASDR